MNKSTKYIGSILFTILIYRSPALADQFDSFFYEAPFSVEEGDSLESVEADVQLYQDNNSYTESVNSIPYSKSNASPIMSLEKGADIFDAAMNINNDFSQGEVDISIAETQMQSAQQEYNAQVTWDFDAGFLHTKATDHSLPKTNHENNAVIKTSVSLTKTLWDKALNYSIESSKQNIQTAKFNQFEEQQGLIELVALAYIEYLSTKDMEVIAQRRINLFRQLTKQIKRKERLGYAANIDVVEVEKQLQTAKTSLLNAQTNSRKAKINIYQLTGRNTQEINYSGSFFQRTNNIELNPVSYLIDVALVNNAELQSLQSEQIALQKIIQEKRAGASPKLNLVSSLSQAWQHGSSDQDSFDYSIGINLKKQLYTGGRINNQVKRAKLELLRIERSTNKKRQDIITQLNILSSEFSGALSSYNSLLKLRKQLAKNIKLIKVAVPYGVRGNRHIYSALDDRFQLENSLIRQFYELIKIKIKVMKITGELDSKNLNQLREILALN